MLLIVIREKDCITIIKYSILTIPPQILIRRKLTNLYNNTIDHNNVINVIRMPLIIVIGRMQTCITIIKLYIVSILLIVHCYQGKALYSNAINWYCVIRIPLINCYQEKANQHNNYQIIYCKNSVDNCNLVRTLYHNYPLIGDQNIINCYQEKANLDNNHQVIYCKNSVDNIIVKGSNNLL